MRRLGFFSWVIALGALVGALRAEAQKLVDERIFKSLDAPLAAGARVTTEPLELEDGSQVTLEVSPFQVFAPGAQIVVHGTDGDTLVPPPSDRWFTGRVAGDLASIVVLARGRSLRGFVMADGRISVIGPERQAYGDGPQGRTTVRTFDPEAEAPDAMRHFTCGTESLPVPPEALALASRAASEAPQPLSNVMYFAGVAVETDYELYAKFNSTTNLATYVGDLFAAASAIYQRDVLVTLQVNYLSIWTTPADPWNATGDTHSALNEFVSYWNVNRSAVPRSTAHMLSGKGLGGGVAYLSALCSGVGYGLSASLSGTAPTNITTTYWDFLVVTHEIGHNFSSPHTHCYSPPVDQCYSGASGCYSGPTSVPPEKGTIMSYCHLVGGYSAIKMFLGVNGETSQAVLTKIRTYVEGRTSCFGTAAGPTVTAIAPGTGPAAGGTAVTITGSGFAAGATVKIGGANATSVVVVNATTITALTPAHAAGLADVTVTKSGSPAYTLVRVFTYTPPPPAVSTVVPASGPTPGLTPVTITGTGFIAGATVSIGGVVATSVVVVNTTTITATTAAHAAGAVSVVVTNPDTQSGALPNGFSYVGPPWATLYYTVTPCRILDTRYANGPLGGPALNGSGAQRLFTVTGACGIPASARSISANLTVTGQTAAGSLTVYPGNGAPSGTTSISFTSGGSRANNAILYLATDGAGTIGVKNDSTSTVHFVLDVNGYFR